MKVKEFKQLLKKEIFHNAKQTTDSNVVINLSLYSGKESWPTEYKLTHIRKDMTTFNLYLCGSKSKNTLEEKDILNINDLKKWCSRSHSYDNFNVFIEDKKENYAKPVNDKNPFGWDIKSHKEFKSDEEYEQDKKYFTFPSDTKFVHDTDEKGRNIIIVLRINSVR